MSKKTNDNNLNHDDEENVDTAKNPVEGPRNITDEPDYTPDVDDEFDDDLEWLDLDELDDLDEDDWETEEDNEDEEDEEKGDTDDGDDADTFPKEYVEKLRRENLHRRKQNKEMREQMTTQVETAYAELVTQLAQNTGIELDNDNNLAEKLTEILNTERQQAQQARRELAIYKATTTADIDPSDLTDSISFNKQLEDLDPNNSEYEVHIAELVNQFAKNTIRAPRRAQRSGTDFSAGINTVTADNSFESLQKQRRERRGVTL